MQVASQNEHVKFVEAYKANHKVLNLQIKQKYLDLIFQGSKIQELREIRPTTEKKYLQFDADGYPKEEPDKFLIVYEPIETDTSKDEDGNIILTYIDDKTEEEVSVMLMDGVENGTEYKYVIYKGEECECVPAIDKKGNILLDENGLPFYAIIGPVELHGCVPKKYDAINFYIGNVNDSDHALVEIKDAHTEFYVDEKGVPLYSEYNGERYYNELIIYNLGAIICSYIAPRANGTKR